GNILVVAFCFIAFVAGIPRPHDKEGPNKRVHEQQPLSDDEHFKGSEHNNEFDHEAFLGDMKEEFDHLSPEEAKRRLKLLITKVDSNGDQSVTAEELKKWVKTVFQKKMVSGMETDVKDKDANNDGFINWDEFLKDRYGEEIPSEDDEEMKKMVERERKHFNVADANKDGKLSSEEFGGFMHPESNPEMQALNAQ
ncbi:hypothetical protein, partial [Salmonella sp. s54925]|uniref:hypothetical protein n=1 Tax=Salmonella sp. s54925 TaxID=3159674 RepID=UPI00397F7F47